MVVKQTFICMKIFKYMVLKDLWNYGLKGILGMGLLQRGPSGTLCGRGLPCALPVEGVSSPYLNWFWLLQSSAVCHLGNSYIFLSAGFLATFPYGGWCWLAAFARHGDSGWAKPFYTCPALLGVTPHGQPADRGSCTKQLGFPSGTTRTSVLRNSHIPCTVHHRPGPAWVYLWFDNLYTCFITRVYTELGEHLQEKCDPSATWYQQSMSWCSEVMSCELGLFLNRQLTYKAFFRVLFCLSDQQLITSGWVSFR